MAFSSLSADACFPDLPDVQSENLSNRIFITWSWLTYAVGKDIVFCHLCVKSLQAKKMTAKRADPSFTQRGFPYWKDVTIAFKKHASFHCQTEAVQVPPRSCPVVGELFSSQYSQQKKTTASVF